jgi:hypothetical protein
MSLNLPISVRLASDRSDRHVTRDLHDLSFRSTAPGGYATASLVLSRPLRTQPGEIMQYGKVVIYDRRTAQVLWEGRLDDPGRSAGSDGEVYSITATGPSTFAEDRTVSLIYVDGRADGWRVGSASIPSVDVQVSEEAVKMGVANGTTHAAGYAGLAVYNNIAYTGQTLARVKWNFVPTFTSVNYECWLGTAIGTGGTVNLATVAVLGANSQTASRGGATAIPAGHDTVRMRFVRVNTPITPSDDLITIQFFPTVRALMMDQFGTDITSGYTVDTVLGSDVVRDLLGRLLDRFDGASASIAATSVAIDQLAYPDGASAAKVLDDLMLLEPAFYWAAWETLDTGLHRFEWTTWPTTVRYEAGTADGFDSPAASGEVYNAVTVRWRDSVGASRSVRLTQPIASLDDAGIVREAYVDISDEVGSAANASQVGNMYLGGHAMPMNQGTLTVSRPIIDLIAGRRVQPWEIKPGNLIRVRDVMPRVDPLNATDRDGVTVFRVAAVDFNASSCTATLELDSYPMTVARAVAKLAKNKITRKR